VIHKSEQVIVGIRRQGGVRRKDLVYENALNYNSKSTSWLGGGVVPMAPSHPFCCRLNEDLDKVLIVRRRVGPDFWDPRFTALGRSMIAPK